jgi:RND superfamily putative drug exporter
MATHLYRLGRFSYRRRGRVTLTWLLLLALAVLGAVSLSGPTSSAFSIPGTESQRAADLLAQRMPQVATDTATGQMVFTVPPGRSLAGPGEKAAVEAAVTRLKALPDVTSVTDPYLTGAVSRTGRTAFATITYSVTPLGIDAADRERLVAAGMPARDAGIGVEVGGTAMQVMETSVASEVVGLGIAAVVLVVTFGAFVAAGLPLLTAVFGVSVGVAGIEIATGYADLSQQTFTLALMIGLAVAIDYALFIVSRYRHDLLTGLDGEEAAGRALGTAGSAVVFAGLTVVIALAALSVVRIPFLAAMGLAAAGTVLVAVLIALTLLPAMLGFLGSRILGRAGRAARDTESDAGPAPLGERWARAVLRHRVPVLLVAVLGLGVLAIPAPDLRLGLPTDASARLDSSPRKAYDQLAEGFGPGFNGPLVIVADLAGSTDRAAATKSLRADLAGVPGVAVVAGVGPATPDAVGDLTVLTVIPTSGPSDAATEDLVQALRDRATGWRSATGANVYVTGQTAINIDVSERVSDALLPYLAVVVGLALVLLLLVFRSVLVPIKATLGFLLSVAATFGATVADFQWGWLKSLVGIDTPGPVVSFLPIFLVGLLFGLAMDYEVFLVSRMREEHVHGASADEAVILGFRHGARVVTAAAVIMTSVFGGFVLAGDSIIKSMGFALAVGVMIDAFVVRMTIVPAVMSLLGDRARWIPRGLDRILPDVDVEGAGLAHRLEASADGADHPEGDLVAG